MSLSHPASFRPYITCQQLLDFIYGYLDGTLPAEDVVEFERHLAVCPSCIHYLDTYKQTVRISKRALQLASADSSSHEAPLPESLVQSILSTLGTRIG
ncbi:MAG: hypothetical protein E6Q99_02435 [Elusimicrobia bacterium]|nr:MAG: hypothetical protein E6Q99_02435 [Elusimicrobiota bacterium]